MVKTKAQKKKCKDAAIELTKQRTTASAVMLNECRWGKPKKKVTTKPKPKDTTKPKAKPKPKKANKKKTAPVAPLTGPGTYASLLGFGNTPKKKSKKTTAELEYERFFGRPMSP